MDSSLAHHTLLEQDSFVYVSGQTLVEKSVDLVPRSVVHSVTGESGDHTAQVILIYLDYHESKSDPPISVVQEIPSPVPTEHGGNHIIPPPSSSILSFDWCKLISFHLPSYVPF